MSKTITEQIEDLQNENAHLKELEKLFDRACKIEFETVPILNLKSALILI